MFLVLALDILEHWSFVDNSVLQKYQRLLEAPRLLEGAWLRRLGKAGGVSEVPAGFEADGCLFLLKSQSELLK